MGNYKMCDILKTAGRRANRSEIWDSGTLVKYMWCTFDLIVFKVIWRSFGAALVSKWHLTRKRLVVERNGVKFETLGHLLHLYRVIWPCRIRDQFEVIRCICLKMACISKMARQRAKWSEIWESWVLVTYIWGTYDLVVFSHFGVVRCTCLKMTCISKRLVIERNEVKFGNQGY